MQKSGTSYQVFEARVIFKVIFLSFTLHTFCGSVFKYANSSVTSILQSVLAFLFGLSSCLLSFSAFSSFQACSPGLPRASSNIVFNTFNICALLSSTFIGCLFCFVFLFYFLFMLIEIFFTLCMLRILGLNTGQLEFYVLRVWLFFTFSLARHIPGSLGSHVTYLCNCNTNTTSAAVTFRWIQVVHTIGQFGMWTVVYSVSQYSSLCNALKHQIHNILINTGPRSYRISLLRPSPLCPDTCQFLVSPHPWGFS